MGGYPRRPERQGSLSSSSRIDRQSPVSHPVSGKLSKEEKEQAQWSNATRCYEQAARDLYYAMQVDFKGKDMKRLQSLYEICRQKGELRDDPELHVDIVVGVGQWTGDPQLFHKWQGEFYMVSSSSKSISLSCGWAKSTNLVLTGLICRCTCSGRDRAMSLCQKMT